MDKAARGKPPKLCRSAQIRVSSSQANQEATKPAWRPSLGLPAASGEIQRWRPESYLPGTV